VLDERAHGRNHKFQTPKLKQDGWHWIPVRHFFQANPEKLSESRDRFAPHSGRENHRSFVLQGFHQMARWLRWEQRATLATSVTTKTL
jgi:hypothetical protein